MNAMELKSKAEAPFLSSWTLCLQAELISAGLRPLIPEREQEDLEKGDTQRTQRVLLYRMMKRVDMQWQRGQQEEDWQAG